VAERKCYINGQFVGSGRQFAKINPVDGTVVAQVHEADRAMVDAAVRGAKAALKGPWGGMALQARVELLRKIAEGIERRFDDFLQAEVADTGKPVSLASHLDIPRGAANFRVFADIVRTYGTESYHLDTPDGKGAVNYAVRKPLGVIGVIAPWNLPLLLLTWKLAPALACGNTIVAKPSEETPSTATLLAEVMHEAGVPAGVYNVVHGFGPDSAGEFITAHPDVNGITFHGETATGAALMKAVAPTVTRIRRLRLRGSGGRDVERDLLQHRAGVPRAGARLRRAADLRALRRCAESQGRSHGARLPAGQGHEHGAADLEAAPREGALLLRA